MAKFICPRLFLYTTSWDFKNLNHVIEDLENDTEKQRYLTFNAQNIHKKIRSEEGINNFIKIIKNIIKY